MKVANLYSIMMMMMMSDDDAILPPQLKADFSFGFDTTPRSILYIHANPYQALLYKGRTRMDECL